MSDAYYLNLYQFSSQLVKDGHKHIKDGNVDFSRQIVRFLRNSSIVSILSSHEYTIGEPNWPLLRYKIDQLSAACIPEDPFQSGNVRTGPGFVQRTIHPEPALDGLELAGNHKEKQT
jgi:hypothetical protein